MASQPAVNLAPSLRNHRISMPEDARQPLPRVAAVLVVHDGEAWLPAVLSTLGAQDYPALDLLVVDNASTDGTAELLQRRIPEQRRLSLPKNMGFPGAVHAAMRHELVAGADYVLLVHDDMLLAPDAVSRLVEAMLADATLAVAGPKLREWAEEPLLQQVGMTVDRFGRAESGVEPGELDQGQADQPRDVLYVSTAGMLLRTNVFAELHGFDVRMPAMRDDLDYCWRVWLTGWRVGVVPDAVAYHVAAGSRGARALWRQRSGQARYLSERHALVAVAKCYGLLRLAWLVPAIFLLGLGKTAAFVLTRRFSAAGATLRAYVWSLGALPRTLQLRREVQRRRVRRDAELRPLFATGVPRLRDYTDAAREWLAGEDTPAILHDGAVAADPTRSEPLAPYRLARDHPVGVVGLLLAVAYAIGLVPLLGQGQLIGGDVLPWPDDATALLERYVSGAAGEPLVSGAAPSPIQAVLGAVGLLGFGSVWAAQRIVVLGLLPLAWLTALRAGRLVTSRAAPRVLGATLYVLSPPVVATLARGRLGELVVAALLPAAVLLTARVAGPRTRRDAAWRATALLALVAAIAIAASPGAGLAVVAVLAVGVVVAVWPGLDRIGWPAARIVTAVVGAGLLLGPWLASLIAAEGVALPSAPPVDLPAWRALALIPDVLPGVGGALGVVSAAATIAVVILALVLGFLLRPLPVAALVTALVASAALGWMAAREGWDWVWAPALLLVGALAVAGLAVVAARTLGPALRARAFGMVQIVAVLGALVLLTGLGAGTWRLATGPWEGLARDVELVPPFVAGEEDRVGPYRLLLVDTDADESLRWTITGADGPRLDTFGTLPSPVLAGHVEQALAGVIGGDPDAGADLGRLNVRYVVLSDDAGERLAGQLVRQPDLEPLAAGGGGVLRVRAWLPRAALLPDDAAERVLSDASPGDLSEFEEDGLPRRDMGVYRGVPAQHGALVVAEAPGQVAVTANGSTLPRLELDVETPVQAFDVPQDAGVVTVRPADEGQRLLMVGLEAVVALALLSLLLRPPGFAQPPAPKRAPAATPSAFRGADVYGRRDDDVTPPSDKPAGTPVGADGTSDEEERGPRDPGERSAPHEDAPAQPVDGEKPSSVEEGRPS